MKPEDLMIGNWVLHDGEPYKIRQLGIYGTTRDGDDYPAVCIGKPKGIGLIVERNEIKPIPLTAEILEKNGFVYKEAEKTCATDAFHLWWLDGSIFTLDDDSWWRSIKDEKLRVKFGGFPLKYVHELQHTLRLCGIDKEIEL